MTPITFITEGIPPCRKGQRVAGARHPTSPLEDFSKWLKRHAWVLKSQAMDTRLSFPILSPVALDVVFHVYDRRIWELSEKLQSCCEALIKAGVIHDDHRFQMVRTSTAWQPCIQGEERAVITLTKTEVPK